MQARRRKMVETAASNVERLLPERIIHTVVDEGFELKVVLFILASGLITLPIGRAQLGLYV
jgi:hypothetical protein